MDEDEERELVRRLQERANAMGPPVELMLANAPGPYRLPKCNYVALNILDPNRAELILDTEHGQRILIEVDSKVVETSRDLTAFALKGAKRD
jgi:hypothetical protein